MEKQLIHKAVKMYQLEIVFSDFDFSYQEKTESSLILSTTYRGVEKRLTHQIHALEIVGSNPTPARKASQKPPRGAFWITLIFDKKTEYWHILVNKGNTISPRTSPMKSNSSGILLLLVRAIRWRIVLCIKWSGREGGCANTIASKDTVLSLS